MKTFCPESPVKRTDKDFEVILRKTGCKTAEKFVPILTIRNASKAIGFLETGL